MEVDRASGCLTAFLYLGLGSVGVEIWFPGKKHILKDKVIRQLNLKPGHVVTSGSSE